MNIILSALCVIILLLMLLHIRLSRKVTILSSSVNSVARKLSIVHGRIDGTLEKIDEIDNKKRK